MLTFEFYLTDKLFSIRIEPHPDEGWRSHQPASPGKVVFAKREMWSSD